MLPSPSSSPRVPLEDRTNTREDDERVATPVKRLFVNLPTPQTESKNGKRRVSSVTLGKRPRLDFSRSYSKDVFDADSESEDSDSDTDMEDYNHSQLRSRQYTTYNMRMRTAMGIPGQRRLPEPSTQPILNSFISSHKSDIFRCHSTSVEGYLTPIYTCSYTHAAKNGGTPLIATATEQGTVHVMNTSRRREWDPELPRTTLQTHENGVFDVKWNFEDTLLATCSGDQTARITNVQHEAVTHVLLGHSGTVKSAAWDPNHPDMLSTGGRDGNICIWDLRVQGAQDEDGLIHLDPVITLPNAHGEPKGRGRPKKAKNVTSVTSLLYPEGQSHGLISSGSSDGILKYWDIRVNASPTKRSRSTKPKLPTLLGSSSLDPTALHGSKRPRGIIRMTAGSGPTAGLIFALGVDSRIHTYALPSLEPVGMSYTHEKLQANSFYVGLSTSPCGRWLASGGAGKSGAFLFDVSNAARPFAGNSVQSGVRLTGQQGEVGAVDWADGMLASCADDGTVRVWRPDVENWRACLENPAAKKWDWFWPGAEEALEEQR